MASRSSRGSLWQGSSTAATAPGAASCASRATIGRIDAAAQPHDESTCPGSGKVAPHPSRESAQLLA
jgi:hypothetical protein